MSTVVVLVLVLVVVDVVVLVLVLVYLRTISLFLTDRSLFVIVYNLSLFVIVYGTISMFCYGVGIRRGRTLPTTCRINVISLRTTRP